MGFFNQSKHLKIVLLSSVVRFTLKFNAKFFSRQENFFCDDEILLIFLSKVSLIFFVKKFFNFFLEYFLMKEISKDLFSKKELLENLFNKIKLLKDLFKKRKLSKDLFKKKNY